MAVLELLLTLLLLLLLLLAFSLLSCNELLVLLGLGHVLQMKLR